MVVSILSPEPDNYSIPIFRTYVEQVAEQTAVRLSEMGENYVSFSDLLRGSVDNQHGDLTDAEEGVDDPIFQELLSRRLRGRHVRAKRSSLVDDDPR